MDKHINNFNAGEFSPYLGARIDFEKYASAVSDITNFNVFPWGGVENRAGTKFITPTKYPNKNTKLIAFEFSVNETYIIEAGHKYCRFIINGELILNADNSIYEIATPYNENELKNLRYCQSVDVLYIVHQNHPPMKLMRYSHTNWQLKELNLKGGPFQDENNTENMVTLSDDNILTSTENLFKNSMEGVNIQLKNPREISSEVKKFTEDAQSDSLEVKGTWTVDTTGAWVGTLKLTRSFDNGTTFLDYRSWNVNKDRNLSESGEEEEDNLLYRLEMVDYVEGTGQACNATLSVQDYYVTGIVKIEKINNAKEAIVSIIDEPLRNQSTNDFALGTFNNYFGYPSVICFYGDRLVFANSKNQPQTIWFSCTGDYENFTADTNPADALIFTISDAQINAIMWLINKKQSLVIGTKNNECLLSPATESEPLHAENKQLTFETQCGSSNFDAIRVNEVILFLQRQGENIRELAYNFQDDGYSSPNMNLLAEHILSGGVADMAYQQLKYSILWCVRNDGVLCGFTYERTQNVTAWHKHTTNGKFKAIAVTSTDTDDTVFCIVEREINGTNQQFIEAFAPRSYHKEDQHFLDCALRYSGKYTETVQNLAHLAGCTVDCVVDGEHIEECSVDDAGVLKLPVNRGGKNILVGFAYECNLTTMNLEIAAQNGSTLNQIKIANEITVKVLNSLGGCVGIKNSRSEPIIYRSVKDTSEVPPLFSGCKKIQVSANANNEVKAVISHKQALPLTILALYIGMK